MPAVQAPHSDPDYARFLERLRGYERIEPFPSNRRPDKLAGMRWLLERLDHPERAYRVVHVAGTNGKGMTSAMIAALLHRAGHRTGLYTSPHVMDLRERVMLDGALISPGGVAAAGHAVLDLADGNHAEVYLSYFDLLTAIGLFAFREAGCAWAVLETGLGGLSDATNAADKALAVLTRIGFDHMYVLGNTLREIATQKLGIVRAGIPTVLGEQDPELESWMAAQIETRGSTPLRATGFRAELVPAPLLPTPGDSVRVTWPGSETASEAVTVAVPGASLTRIKCICAANALCAAEQVLGPAKGSERAARVRTAFSTELPGRLERRTRQRVRGSDAQFAQMVLDGGHNAGALAALTDELERWGVKDYALIIGLQADKLVEEVRVPLRRLLAHASRILILTPQTARAPKVETLAEFLRSAQAPSNAAPIEVQSTAREALLAAARAPERPLVATGSFWMLGDLMRELESA